ncbi:MAG: hypothetical protein LBC41_07435 [Clostridiales bacterium]|jgi:hypothetical protein|nr:hypothetical protein [Clostridiales bacterium]MDR2750475.1 hypothetical protein [Clostridiales bacterium]
MGLVIFRKDLNYEDFLALTEKDPDTIYFINDTHRIYVGDTAYGGTDILFEDSETISLSIVNSALTAQAFISGDVVNALELRADGLYAPPASVRLIEDGETNELVQVREDEIVTSRLRLSEMVTNTSTDWTVPTANAVYSAIAKVAPVWNSTSLNDAILPQENEERQWLDYSALITASENVQANADFNQLYSDGHEVVFNLCLEIGAWVTQSSFIAPLSTICSIPQKIAPTSEITFSASGYSRQDPSTSISDIGGSLIFDETGAVKVGTKCSAVYTSEAYVVCSGRYSIN